MAAVWTAIDLATVIFVDCNMVFYSIDHPAIPIVLSKYGMPQLLITNVMQLCIWTYVVVATAH